MLKREATLLIERITESACEVEGVLNFIATHPAPDTEPMDVAMQRAVDLNRSIRFDAARLGGLLARDEAAMRSAFANSLHAVDGIRYGTALTEACADAKALFANAEEDLADIQQALVQRFPLDVLGG